MSTLATRTTTNPIATVKPGMDIATMGKYFAESGFFKDSQSLAKAIVKIKAGEELGIPPVAAMTGIYIVKEKVMVGAQLLASAVENSGRYGYRVEQLDDKGCKLQFFKHGQPSGVSEFTVKDAVAAGLMGNQTYKAYPRNMFFSRAMSNGVRWYCAGVFSGPVYTPEELGVPTTPSGEPIVNDGEPRQGVKPRTSSAMDLIEEPPEQHPVDASGSKGAGTADCPPPPPAQPELPPVEDPPCGYADVGDWFSALVKLAETKGINRKGVDAAVATTGATTYLTTTVEQRRDLWARLYRKEGK